MSRPSALFKPAIALVLGIVSAPYLKPLAKKTLKSSVKASLRMKQLASEATMEFKVLAAEAIQETVAASNGTGSDVPTSAT